MTKDKTSKRVSCPECGSFELGNNNAFIFFDILLFFVVGLLASTHRLGGGIQKEYKCKVCGYKWEEES